MHKGAQPGPEYQSLVSTCISDDRFDSYRLSSDTAEIGALARYLRNISLCEALYPVLCVLEVSLRNRIHAAMSQQHGPDWLNSAKWLRPLEQDKVVSATQQLIHEGKQPDSGRILAQLSFGFWVAMFNAHYRRYLGAVIRDVFSDAPSSPALRRLSADLNNLRKLRNRVYHYEPIWHWRNLDELHSTALRLLRWTSRDWDHILPCIDRFKVVSRRSDSFFVTRLPSPATQDNP